MSTSISGKTEKLSISLPRRMAEWLAQKAEEDMTSVSGVLQGLLRERMKTEDRERMAAPRCDDSRNKEHPNIFPSRERHGVRQERTPAGAGKSR